MLSVSCFGGCYERAMEITIVFKLTLFEIVLYACLTPQRDRLPTERLCELSVKTGVLIQCQDRFEPSVINDFTVVPTNYPLDEHLMK